MADSVLAAISIVVEDPGSVEALNAILHDYAPCIIGRMGHTLPAARRELHLRCGGCSGGQDKRPLRKARQAQGSHCPRGLFVRQREKEGREGQK